MATLNATNLKHASSSSNNIVLAADGSTTISGNATCSGTATGFGGGKILQVVPVYKGDRFTTGSTSFVDVTGLSVTITPTAANSTILLQGAIHAGTRQSNLDHGGGIRVMRSIAGGSFSNDNKLNGLSDGSRDRITFRLASISYNSDHMTGGFGFCGVDDPSYSVGNAIVYKVQIVCQSGSYPSVVNGSAANTNNGDIYAARAMSSLIAMEIGA